MSKTGSRILNGAQEALVLAKGEANAGDYRIHISSTIDVRAIRKTTGLSQAAFAARFGFSIERVRDWEQGRSAVDAPSHILLTAIQKEPE